jgi:RNA polymerase sigma factor (sigma-70 family)
MSKIVPIREYLESHRANPPALAPAVPRDGPIPPEIDRVLSLLGCRAAAGDPAALNTLHAAYAPRLSHWIYRAQRTLLLYGADRAVEPDDIAQEAFVVFADLIRTWEGDRDLSRYLIAYFPWRLRDAVRRMTDVRIDRSLDASSRIMLADGSHRADESVALLQALAAELPARDGRILLLRIRDGLTWDEVARQSGIERRTALRVWKRLLGELRASLTEPR